MRKLQKLYKIVKENKKIILQWIFIFLVTPIVLGFIIMRPKLFHEEKIPIPGDGSTPNPTQINSTQQNSVAESEVKNGLSEALFGTALTLKWDNYCLHNNNDVSVNGKKIKLPFENDAEAGAMEIKIDYADEQSDTIYSRVGDNSVCYPVKRIKKNITAIFRKPSRSSFELIFKSLQTSANGGVLELEQGAYVHTENSFIIRKQYWGEFLTKEIILVIGWMILIVNLKETLHFFKK